VALGSAKETRACFDAAVALGYVGGIHEAVTRGLDSVCAVLFRLA
jgi:hypothetical protein